MSFEQQMCSLHATVDNEWKNLKLFSFFLVALRQKYTEIIIRTSTVKRNDVTSLNFEAFAVWLLFKQLRESQTLLSNSEVNLSFKGSRLKITGAAKWLWIRFSPLSKSIKLYFHSLVIIAEKKRSSEWQKGRERPQSKLRMSTNGIRKLISICVVSFDCWAYLSSALPWHYFFRMEIQLRDSVLIECFLLFLLIMLLWLLYVRSFHPSVYSTFLQMTD